MVLYLHYTTINQSIYLYLYRSLYSNIHIICYTVYGQRSGGLEYLFNNIKHYTVVVQEIASAVDHKPHDCITINDLIRYLCIRLCDPERIDMFVAFNNGVPTNTNSMQQSVELMSDVTVRPGILVLINDCDWEIYNQGEYIIQPNDNITMISTLHGG